MWKVHDKKNDDNVALWIKFSELNFNLEDFVQSVLDFCPNDYIFQGGYFIQGGIDWLLY